MGLLTKIWQLVRGVREERPPLIETNYSFSLPVDASLPASPGCFQACVNEHHAGQLSYQQFLDAVFAHFEPTSPIHHPEDVSLANLESLSAFWPIGPLAAAIKLCLLSESVERTLSQDIIVLLHAMESGSPLDQVPPVHALAALPPLHLQVLILAAISQQKHNLAIDILSANPVPPPPERLLFNLLGSAVCPVGTYGKSAFVNAPMEFWLAAVEAGWAAPSPALAVLAAEAGPAGGPLLRVLLGKSELDLNLIDRVVPVHTVLADLVATDGDDPSLLRDIVARVPPKQLARDLLSQVVYKRQEGGVEMLAILLDRGQDINYRKIERVSRRDQQDPWAGDAWYQRSLTPLSMAARKGNKSAVSFLISRGAKLNVRDFYGRTAIELARYAGHHEIVEMLEQAAKPRIANDKILIDK